MAVLELSKIKTLSFGSGANKAEVYPRTLINAITDQNGQPLETYLDNAITKKLEGFMENETNLDFVTKDDVYNKTEIDEQIGKIHNDYVLKTDYTSEMANLRSSIVGSVNSGLSTLESLSKAINNDPNFFQTVQNKLDEKVNITNLEENYYSKSDVYTITEVDATLNNYYTKEEVFTKEQVELGLSNISQSVTDNFATKETLTQEVETINNTLENDFYDIDEADNLLMGKVDKISGKSLSEEDFTTEYKTKLDNIEEYATNYIHPSTHSASMITGLHNVAISGNYENLNNKPDGLSDFDNDCDFTTNESLRKLETKIQNDMEQMSDEDVSDMIYNIFYL